MPPSDKRQQYERWVEDHSSDLYRFAYRLSGRADLAEDLTQETFFHAWRSIHTLRDPDRARAWLFQILRHRWSHLVRHDARRPNITAPLHAVADRGDRAADNPLQRLADRDQLQHALDQLDERYRLPLLMVLAEGMTCREAAEQLDIPLGTVLSRIHRARATLQSCLSDDGREETHDSTDDAPPLRFGGVQ